MRFAPYPGHELGPADLAASRRMKTTRVGGGHPGYRTIADPDPENPDAPRTSYQQDPWHYSIARMVDACTSVGALSFYGPYGDIRDVEGCETQFRASFLLGCVGAWSLHPVQIAIAKKVYSPDPEEVAFAKKVIAAIPDGRGVHMIDGKMQDDATWKQCKVMVNLAEMLARKDRSWPRRTGLQPARGASRGRARRRRAAATRRTQVPAWQGSVTVCVVRVVLAGRRVRTRGCALVTADAQADAPVTRLAQLSVRPAWQTRGTARDREGVVEIWLALDERASTARRSQQRSMETWRLGSSACRGRCRASASSAACTALELRARAARGAPVRARSWTNHWRRSTRGGSERGVLRNRAIERSATRAIVQLGATRASMHHGHSRDAASNSSTH